MIGLLLVAGLLQGLPPEDPGVRVVALLAEEDGLLARLDDLDRQIARLTREQADQGATLEAAQARMAELDAQLEVIHLRASTQRARLVRRLRARDHMASTAWLQVLLSATSPDELVRHRHYLERILGADVALLSAMKADRAMLALLRDEREQAVAATRRVSDDLDKRRATLEADRAVRTELLQRLRGERRLMRRLMAGQLDRRADVAELLARDARPGPGLEGHFAEEYGRLPFPVPGPIVGPFGERVDAEAGGTRVFSSGVRIEAAAGIPVRAVYSGRVAFAGWYQGFGNLVILDHGEGYHTLYAHLADIRCAAEAVVAQGEILGPVGDTGSLVGPQLYFEVRVEGQAEDPRKWLRR
ncbi:MAG: peptidoglycan DD-metalloendopeptidase family protein [bacterium]